MSEFGIRGFIEGFYGRVWSDEKRRRVLSLVADKGMNSYFYAPKDDPYLRSKWRSEYDKASLDKFSSLFDFTKSINVNLWYCLSPGLDMVYSSENDFDDLKNKYISLYNLGVRYFGLFLDDIPDKLVKADEDKFGNVLNAHISLVNKLYSSLPLDVSLVVCPMQYHGNGSEEYISGLCKNISPEIYVFWTGKKICSPELTSTDAQSFYEFTGRKPLYWDNYPVNDAEMYGEMHIGPYLNRSSELGKYCEGIVSNVMEYPLASCISLLTVCDYLNDPYSYDPESSFASAAETVTGDKYESWMPFLDHTRFSCLNDCFSEYLTDVLNSVRNFYFADKKTDAAAALDEIIAEYELCSGTIKQNELFDEIKTWVSRFDDITEILVKMKKYILSSDEISRTELKNSMIAYNRNAYKLAGFGLREVTENLIGEFTI